MTTCEASATSALFPAHLFTPDEREEVLRNNMVLDWHFGQRKILEGITVPELASFVEQLRGMSHEEVEHSAARARLKSVLMTSIFLSGKCDAQCAICYTDRTIRSTDLSIEEIKQVIRQTKGLGNKTIYIPGEGEPFLDKGLFSLLDLARELDQQVVIFTDGLLLSDEAHCQRMLGRTLDEVFEAIRNSPVYLYVKYWHSNRQRFAEMMRISPQQIKTERVTLNGGQSIDVPTGILRLIEVAPEKAGIETAVHSVNFDDVFQNLMPFVKQYQPKWYLEPIIHSGRYAGRHEYDLTSEQHLKISPYLTKQQCKRTGFSTVLMATGHLSYCPSFVTNLSVTDKNALNELSIRSAGPERIRDLFSMLHSNEFIVRARYAAYTHSCLCDYFARKMEDAQWQDLPQILMSSEEAREKAPSLSLTT
jgi:organic radical activating enzyme